MILGFHGKMGAGKSECARRLALYSSLPVIEVSFAAKLKESAAAVLGCTVSELEIWKNLPDVRVQVRDVDRGETVTDQSARSFLQRYGTEGHRDVFGQDFWLDAALPITLSDYGDALYVVTDVRFANEAQRVRDLGGIVVKVLGPIGDTGTHASERELDGDFTVDNARRDDGYASLDRQLIDLLPGWARAARVAA